MGKCGEGAGGRASALGVAECVRALGRPLAGACGEAGEAGSLGAGVGRGGLPCSDKTGFSVPGELALRWQLWEWMSLCAKTRAVRLFGHFPLLLLSTPPPPALKKKLLAG